MNLKLNRTLATAAVLAFTGVGIMGCDRNDAKKTGDTVQTGADKTGAAANQGMQNTNDAAHQAGADMKQGAQNASDAAGQAAHDAKMNMEKAADKTGDAVKNAGDRIGNAVTPTTTPSVPAPDAATK